MTALRREKTCSVTVDSHFLRSKSTKCMEIVSNPPIMDVSHTMDSYGPSSVWLAIIALFLWGALSAAEIGKAHRMQALAAIHNCESVQKSKWGEGLSVSDICDLWLAISSGDGQHNKATNSVCSKQGISIEIKKLAGPANTKQSIMGRERGGISIRKWKWSGVLCSKCYGCQSREENHIILRCFKVAAIYTAVFCIHAVPPKLVELVQ